MKKHINDLGNKIFPDYRPISVDRETSEDVEKSTQHNVIVPNISFPIKTLFGKPDFNSDVSLDIQCNRHDVSKFKLSWNKVPNAKFIIEYSLDGKTLKSDYTWQSNYIIKYPVNTEIVYVLIKYVIDDITYISNKNMVSILCVDIYEKDKITLDSKKIQIDEATSIPVKEVSFSDISNVEFSYIGKGVARVEWLSSTPLSKTKVIYNKVGESKDNAISVNVKPSINYATLEIESGTEYEVYICVQQSDLSYNVGALYKLEYNLTYQTGVSLSWREISQVFNSKLFQNKTLLHEALRLANLLYHKIEQVPFNPKDLNFLTKEYRLDYDMGGDDFVFSVDKIELIKPISSFKGTRKDIEYLAKLFGQFDLELFKITKIPDDIKGLLPDDYDSDYVPTLKSGIYSGGNPDESTPYGYSGTKYGNIRFEDNITYDKKACYYDAIARVDLQNPELDTTDMENIMNKVRALFKKRIYVCMGLRYVVVVFKVLDEYDFDVDDLWSVLMEQFQQDDFFSIYCDTLYGMEGLLYDDNTKYCPFDKLPPFDIINETFFYRIIDEYFNCRLTYGDDTLSYGIGKKYCSPDTIDELQYTMTLALKELYNEPIDYNIITTQHNKLLDYFHSLYGIDYGDGSIYGKDDKYHDGIVDRYEYLFNHTPSLLQDDYVVIGSNYYGREHIFGDDRLFGQHDGVDADLSFSEIYMYLSDVFQLPDDIIYWDNVDNKHTSDFMLLYQGKLYGDNNLYGTSSPYGDGLSLLDYTYYLGEIKGYISSDYFKAEELYFGSGSIYNTGKRFGGIVDVQDKYNYLHNIDIDSTYTHEFESYFSFLFTPPLYAVSDFMLLYQGKLYGDNNLYGTSSPYGEGLSLLDYTYYLGEIKQNICDSYFNSELPFIFGGHHLFGVSKTFGVNDFEVTDNNTYYYSREQQTHYTLDYNIKFGYIDAEPKYVGDDFDISTITSRLVSITPEMLQSVEYSMYSNYYGESFKFGDGIIHRTDVATRHTLIPDTAKQVESFDTDNLVSQNTLYSNINLTDSYDFTIDDISQYSERVDFYTLDRFNTDSSNSYGDNLTYGYDIIFDTSGVNEFFNLTSNLLHRDKYNTDRVTSKHNIQAHFNLTDSYDFTIDDKHELSDNLDILIRDKVSIFGTYFGVDSNVFNGKSVFGVGVDIHTKKDLILGFNSRYNTRVLDKTVTQFNTNLTDSYDFTVDDKYEIKNSENFDLAVKDYVTLKSNKFGDNITYSSKIQFDNTELSDKNQSLTNYKQLDRFSSSVSDNSSIGAILTQNDTYNYAITDKHDLRQTESYDLIVRDKIQLNSISSKVANIENEFKSVVDYFYKLRDRAVFGKTQQHHHQTDSITSSFDLNTEVLFTYNRRDFVNIIDDGIKFGDKRDFGEVMLFFSGNSTLEFGGGAVFGGRVTYGNEESTLISDSIKYIRII